MPKHFPKRKGVHEHFHTPPAKRGADFSTQQLCRRPREEELQRFGVEHAAHEALPFRYDLDLIEAEGERAVGAQLRLASEDLFQQPVEIGQADAGEPVILEGEEQQRFPRPALGEPIRQLLPKEGAFACPPYADDGYSLPLVRRDPDITTGSPIQGG